MKVSFCVCPKCGKKEEAKYQNYVISSIRDLNLGYKIRYNMNNIIKRMIFPSNVILSRYYENFEKAYFYGCSKCGYVFKLEEIFDGKKAGKCWKEFEVESFTCKKCGTEISKTPNNVSFSGNDRYICYNCCSVVN